MEELYWITRLDSINSFVSILTIISSIAAIILMIFNCFAVFDSNFEDEKVIKKLNYKVFPTWLLITLLFIFTPTSKEAYMIWGIGGTIDYIKSNETIKQIPDKCVKAIDILLDKYLTKESESKNTNNSNNQN